MSEPNVCVTPNKFVSMLCNFDSVESKIFINEINVTEKMSRTLCKYITVLDYSDKSQVDLSGAGSGVSLFPFTVFISEHVGIASAWIILVFLVTNGIVTIFF